MLTEFSLRNPPFRGGRSPRPKGVGSEIEGFEMTFGGVKPSLSLRPVAELTDACQTKCEDQ